MRVGVWLGNSMVDEQGSKRSMNDVYLIENPCESDLKVKEVIMKLLDEERIKREQKAAIKCIPLSKLEAGRIYEDVSGLNYLYTGRKTVEVDAWCAGSKRSIESQVGNCFAWVYKFEKSTDNEILAYAVGVHFGRSGYHNVNVIKDNKKLRKKVYQIVVSEKIEMFKETLPSYHRAREECTVTIY